MAIRWYALLLGLVFVFQYRGTGATVVQVVALVGAAVLVQQWIMESVEFSPFSVTIKPLAALLRESGLATLEQLRQLREQDALPDSPLQGVRFTLLRVGVWSPTSTLVFWPDRNTFSTEVEASWPIEELTQPSRELLQAIGVSEMYPYLHMNHRAEGIELSVSRAGEHEERAVALLPWSAFHIKQWRHGALSDQKATRVLAKHGWTRGKPDVDVPSAPFELSHQYFDVTWRYI